MIKNFKKCIKKFKNNKINDDNILNEKHYDLLKKIRNLTTLDEEELLFIKSLPSEQLFEIICIYNSYTIMINNYILSN